MKKRLSIAVAILLALAIPVCAADLVSTMTHGLISTPGGTNEADPSAGREGDSQVFTPSITDPEVNAERVAEIEKILLDWARLKLDDAAARFGVSPADAASRIALLTSLKNFYPRIENAILRARQDAAELQRMKDDTTPPELRMTDKPPFSLTFHDAFIGTLEEVNKKIAEVEENMKRANSSTDSIARQKEDVEADWRFARDSYKKSPTRENQWKLETASLELEYALCIQALDRINWRQMRITLENYNLQLNRQTALQIYICNNLDLSEEGYNRELNELNERIKKLEGRSTPVTRQLRQAERLASDAELKYASLSPDASEDEKNYTKCDLEYRLADRERCRLLIEQHQEMLTMLALTKRLWGLRYDLARKAIDRTTIPETIKNMDRETADLYRNLSQVQKKLLELQAQQSAIEKELEESSTTQKSRAVLRKHRDVIQRTIESCLNFITAIRLTEAQERHFVSDLQAEFNTINLVERLRRFWRVRVEKVLTTELWASGGYTVRLQEFLIAFAITVFGTWIARHLVHLLTWFLARRNKLDETRRRTFDRFIGNFAAIVVFIIALYIVGIPLTAFAFLGGAAAISIGFGAQDIFKNLMGGIMLTLNRTFRIGDIIETSGVCGTVADVGMRCTIIRTFDEKEVIVPNADLTANRLTNWSLSDSLLRVPIEIGVEYGTDVKKVRETLLKVVDSNAKIMKTPAPWVCFGNFGDSAYEFTLYFWINQKIIGAARIGSEVREAITIAFAKEDIVIAFPHMDVNLYSGRLTVQRALPEPPEPPEESKPIAPAETTK